MDSGSSAEGFVVTVVSSHVRSGSRSCSHTGSRSSSDGVVSGGDGGLVNTLSPSSSCQSAAAPPLFATSFALRAVSLTSVGASSVGTTRSTDSPHSIGSPRALESVALDERASGGFGGDDSLPHFGHSLEPSDESHATVVVPRLALRFPRPQNFSGRVGSIRELRFATAAAEAAAAAAAAVEGAWVGPGPAAGVTTCDPSAAHASPARPTSPRTPAIAGPTLPRTPAITGPTSPRTPAITGPTLPRTPVLGEFSPRPPSATARPPVGSPRGAALGLGSVLSPRRRLLAGLAAAPLPALPPSLRQPGALDSDRSLEPTVRVDPVETVGTPRGDAEQVVFGMPAMANFFWATASEAKQHAHVRALRRRQARYGSGRWSDFESYAREPFFVSDCLLVVSLCRRVAQRLFARYDLVRRRVLAAENVALPLVTSLHDLANQLAVAERQRAVDRRAARTHRRLAKRQRTALLAVMATTMLSHAGASVVLAGRGDDRTPGLMRGNASSLAVSAFLPSTVSSPSLSAPPSRPRSPAVMYKSPKASTAQSPDSSNSAGTLALRLERVVDTWLAECRLTRRHLHYMANFIDSCPMAELATPTLLGLGRSAAAALQHVVHNEYVELQRAVLRHPDADILKAVLLVERPASCDFVTSLQFPLVAPVPLSRKAAAMKAVAGSSGYLATIDVVVPKATAAPSP